MGPLVRSLSYASLPALTQDVILEDLTNPEGCRFEDYQLICENELPQELYNIGPIQAAIDLNADYTGNIRGFETLIRFEADRLTVLTSQGEADTVFYRDLDVSSTLNFSGTEQQQITALLAFINAIVLHYRPVWTPVIMASKTLSSLAIFLIFVSINALLLKPRLKKISFKELFVLMTYASTGLYLIWIFDALIPLNIFVFLLLLIFAFRRTSRLALVLQMQEQPPVE